MEKSDQDEKVIPFTKKGHTSNFKDFGEAVMKNDTQNATRILRDILGLDYKTSEKSAIDFIESYKKDPSFLMETMQIRSHIVKDQNNEALALIQKMFHLDGSNGMIALNSMKKIIANVQK